MRNYYKTLELRATSSAEEIQQKISSLAMQEPELADKALKILTNPVRKSVYDTLHSQYFAIAMSHSVLATEGMLDTNNWDRRLIEFYDDDSSLTTSE